MVGSSRRVGQKRLHLLSPTICTSAVETPTRTFYRASRVMRRSDTVMLLLLPVEHTRAYGVTITRSVLPDGGDTRPYPPPSRKPHVCLLMTMPVERPHTATAT